MKRVFPLVALIIASLISSGQNSAEKLLISNNALSIGGYGEVHYNQSLQTGTINNGTLDVHRMVMLFGYKFNDKLNFVTELEFEHVKEVYVEQAFLQYQITKGFNFRAGLLLIPVGYINEYHEPINFLSVERPIIDQYIVPSTWREIGFGVSGNILPASLKYQLYVVGGPKGYDDAQLFKGGSGIRKGRQKGAEAIVHSPGITGKLNYYGIKNLNMAVSGYAGYSESSMFVDLDRNDALAIQAADSSRVFISMLAFDSRYRRNAFIMNTQLYYLGLSNTEAYNKFNTAESNDLGSSMLGAYVELAYNLLSLGNSEHELLPFVRLEYMNTHLSTDGDLEKNPDYNQQIVTSGIAWKLHQGAVVKCDLQWKKRAGADKGELVFNAGVGVSF